MKKPYKPEEIADLFIEYINSGTINGTTISRYCT